MSEQVREGVWRTRDGREIAVRARDFGDAAPTSWGWYGMIDGRFEVFCDDGRNTVLHTPQPLDLVEFLRPLPGTEAAPEPQPVEIREGVWKMRGGNEIEVRAGSDFGDWPYRGQDSEGEIYWCRDGRLADSGAPSDCDLVTYLRPLPGTEAEPAPEAAPEPQTTTDTLAQIEGQIDQAEPWERLAVALQQQLTESLAERDRLQRELTDMANHAVELLESAQQARDERDLLAQKLMTKPSEEALQKENSRKQIEINTLQDKLQDVTSDRDRLQARVRDLEIEIDAAGQQPAPADKSEQIERIWDESRERAVSEIIELLIPLQVATGTHAEAVLQILPAVIRRWMDGGSDDVE
jgi:hypothetical protein